MPKKPATRAVTGFIAIYKPMDFPNKLIINKINPPIIPFIIILNKNFLGTINNQPKK